MEYSEHQDVCTQQTLSEAVDVQNLEERFEIYCKECTNWFRMLTTACRAIMLYKLMYNVNYFYVCCAIYSDIFMMKFISMH